MKSDVRLFLGMAGRDGAFEFRTETRLPTSLVGTADGTGWMMSPAQPIDLAIEVPRGSLPQGVGAMSFSVPVVTGEIAFIGMPSN